MTYAAAIHQCLTARERKRAQDVIRALNHQDIASEQAFTVMLQSKLQELGLDAAEVHPVQMNQRVDVVVNGRTIMSWTPTLN